MIDAEDAWSTDRLLIEPLNRADARELFPVLDDPRLHEYIGGSPLPLPELTDRYTRLESRSSADGSEVWCNWVLRERTAGSALGTLQATLPAGGPVQGPAHVAWVVGGHAQGRGYATEAAVSLVERLRADGWAVVADVHPDHTASQRVAHHAGLRPTDQIVDGEIRWERAAQV